MQSGFFYWIETLQNRLAADPTVRRVALRLHKPVSHRLPARSLKPNLLLWKSCSEVRQFLPTDRELVQSSLEVGYPIYIYKTEIKIPSVIL